MMAAARVSAVVLLFALVAATSSTAGSSADATSPRLTRNVPGIVQLTCLFVDKDAPIKIVCPPLVPVTKYRKVAGVHGTVMGYGDPHLKAPRNRLYLVGFNAGDTGPTYWHWIAGMGPPEAIQY